MRFASFGLVALSALFSTTFAAPAAQLEGVSGITNAVTGVVGGVTGSGSASGGASGSALGGLGGIIKRTDEELCDKLSSTLATVKEHTGTINSTVASYQKSKGDKAELIVTIKGEVTVIVSLLATLVADISALVSDIGSITGELKTRVVGLVWSIIVEILFTLKYTLVVVKISIWELLGGLIIALLSVCFSLLAVLNVLAGDILKLVFGLLGSVHGVLTLVLGGLSVIIKGFLGGFLSIVGNVGGIFGGIMSCIL